MSARPGARSAPGLLVALALGSGIAVSGVTGAASSIDPAGCFALSLTASAAFVLLLRQLRGATASGAAVALLAVQGFCIGAAADREIPGMHMRRALIVGRVAGPPRERVAGSRFILDRVAIRDSLWRPHSGLLLVNLAGRSGDSLRIRPRYGDRVALHGILLTPSPARNPGDFDMKQWYRANGLTHEVLVRGGASVRILGRGDAGWLGLQVVEPARQWAVGALREGYGGQAREFMMGLLLGIRDGIDAETQAAFVNAGVAHILAVSGSNVAIVAAVVLFLLALVRCPLRYTPLPVALALALYMLLTGSQPPVVRATVMALLIIGGRLIQRRVGMVNVIGVAALVVLIDSPRLLFDAGFQLSFAAVLSLVLFYPLLDRRIVSLKARPLLRPPLVWTLRLAAVSFVATVGTLPITALTFGRLSLIGIMANIPVVPLSGASVILSAAGLVFRAVLPGLAPGFEAINGLILNLTLEIARVAGSLPYASIDTSTWTVLETVPCIAGAGAFLCARRSRGRRMLGLATLGGLALCALFTRPSVFVSPARSLEISVIDVGQGDAILVRFPDGAAMLVDAGPRTPGFDSGSRVVAPLLTRMGVNRLKYLVLTHAHADHAGGMDGVLRSIPVDTIVVGAWSDSGARRPPDVLRRPPDLPRRRLSAGTILSPTVDSRVYVFWPRPGPVPHARYPENDRSLVLKVVFGDFSILLTGDAEKGVERLLVDRYAKFLGSTVLKVAHHGSSTGTSSPFLDAVRPDLAVLSVGTLNRFGHPSSGVLASLAGRCPVARTDTEGCVVIRTDGRAWEKADWRREP